MVGFTLGHLTLLELRLGGNEVTLFWSATANTTHILTAIVRAFNLLNSISFLIL